MLFGAEEIKIPMGCGVGVGEGQMVGRSRKWMNCVLGVCDNDCSKEMKGTADAVETNRSISCARPSDHL